MTDPELERLRRKRMLELQRRAQAQQARERLARVRLARPQLAQAVENYLIQLAQSGRLNGRVDEDQLKRLLKQVSEATRKDFKIRIERK
ncbi:MAG: DNA-binding protein [Methanopyraceae archaeon]